MKKAATSSPCGGCPPCCTQCVFSAAAATSPTSVTEVVSKDEYGCVRPDGGAVVLADGVLSMMRGDSVHPVTRDGAEFLHRTGNSLSVHC